MIFHRCSQELLSDSLAYEWCPKMLFIILPLLLLLAEPLHTKGDLYYVKPNDYNKTCPGEPCETLSHYVTNVSEYFRSDRTFQFISGHHLLAHNLEVGGIQNLTLIGDEHFLPGLLDLPAPSSQIHCNGSVGLGFHAIRKLSIRNLLFSGCGRVLESDSHVRAALALGGAGNGSIFDVNISRITVQNSTGYGLLADNILGTSFITNSNFHFNNGFESYSGGNARIVFTACLHLENSSTTLSINSSNFLFAFSPLYLHLENYYDIGAGLALTIIDDSCSNVTVYVSHITAYGNIGRHGGNMAIYFQDTDVLTNTVFVNNSLIMNGNATNSGGGLYIAAVSESNVGLKPVYCGKDNTALLHPIVFVTKTTFLNNVAQYDGGAAHIAQILETPQECITRVITFEDCTWMNNTSITSGNSIHIEEKEVAEIYNRTYISPHLEVAFRHCAFSDNCDTHHNMINYFSMPYGVITLISAKKVYFSGCTFEDNCGTAIFASSSNIIFENNNTFTNNTGYNGGALHLCEGSLMYLSGNTHLNFSYNHAHAGGAIYAEKRCTFYSHFLVTPCFFQIVEPTNPENVHLSFQNNTVEFAGKALYGGTIANCFNALNSYTQPVTFDQLFHLNNSKLDPSLVSSDPVGVCFCRDSSPDCSLKVLHISVYPGENFTIPATTVGQRNGTVPGDIHAEFTDNTDNHTSIEPFQNSQTVTTYRSCANLMYTVHSPDKLAILKLKVDKSFLTQAVAWVTPSLNITLKECPPGFHISGTTYLCECATELKHHNIKCDINTNSIYRPPSTWIGYHNATGDKSGILMYSHCPLGYCKSTTTELHISSPDTQCAMNRSGVLCGACKSGLSLALGTSQCLDCSNKTLALLIAFSVAGLALVLLLVTCNLTVTEGTINGLIFYANIIWINRSIFFPRMTTNVLTVFIAWLNLDLGIQTCFYNGLDTYTKVWLQFVFPLYIWFLVAAIIYLSHQSTFVAKLIGNNSVKALATLFLLSYAKLQRTIIAALSVTFLTYPDGSNKWLWLYDANIEYLRGKHIPLFIVALLALLFLSLPYTLLLLFIQCLRRLGGHKWRLLSWVARLLPLFDAYTAPYKFQYQFWTGFVLLMRVLLFLVFALNYSDQPSVNLMVTVVATFFVFMLAWSLGGIYKNQVLNTLESSFLLNLGVVSVATLYTLHVGGNQAAVIDTSVGIALVMFFGIVVYQCLATTRLGRAIVEKFKSFIQWNHQRLRGPVATDSDSDPAEKEPLIPPHVRYDPSHYREPLLSP